MVDEETRRKLRELGMGEMIYDGRKIDGVLICEAGTCQFVASAANGVIEGLTGADKSYLACCDYCGPIATAFHA